MSRNESQRWPAASQLNTDFTALARETAPEELPALVGKLAEAQALALARLTAPINGHESPAAPQDRMLCMSTVAERLGVSLYTARAMGRRGELPVTTLGRRVGVRESSLGRFLERRECGGR
jgi:excisionase family DNA binding protein